MKNEDLKNGRWRGNKRVRGPNCTGGICGLNSLNELPLDLEGRRRRFLNVAGKLLSLPFLAGFAENKCEHSHRFLSDLHSTHRNAFVVWSWTLLFNLLLRRTLMLFYRWIVRFIILLLFLLLSLLTIFHFIFTFQNTINFMCLIITRALPQYKLKLQLFRMCYTTNHVYSSLLVFFFFLKYALLVFLVLFFIRKIKHPSFLFFLSFSFLHSISMSKCRQDFFLPIVTLNNVWLEENMEGRGGVI